MKLFWAVFSMLLACFLCQSYYVMAQDRYPEPSLSFLNINKSVYKQVFNPTWIGLNNQSTRNGGLLVQTQDCDYQTKCNHCKGSGKKASFLTTSEAYPNIFNRWGKITADNITFEPRSDEDSWGIEDPSLTFDKKNQIYYMFYTATNSKDTLLSLATTNNPYNHSSWRRYGPVFPRYPRSKGGSLLIREKGPHYLYWGDNEIRVALSDNLTFWQDIGEVLIKPRPQKFDAKFVKVGPPPLLLSDGNYILFYNTADISWPEDQAASSFPGWVILDGNDPTKILQRSQKPLFYPVFDWEKGLPPYSCNSPNKISLTGGLSFEDNSDIFYMVYGGADATVGQVMVRVQVPKANLKEQ